MLSNEDLRAPLVEELISEFEQSVDINDEREEEAYAQYAWEKDVDKSWELLVDKDGVLQFIQPKNRNIVNEESNLDSTVETYGDAIPKRGIIRNLVIIFDMSHHMRELDFKPDRLYCGYGAVKDFIYDLFHQCPITQLALIGLRSMSATLISQLGTNPDEQIELLGNVIKNGAEGTASLQNGLDLSIKILSTLPSYMTREVLIIFGSNNTLDPGNILTTLDDLKTHHISVTAISFSPELYILKHICIETGGTYSVARDAIHLKELFTQNTTPPPWRNWMESALIKVGFPPLKKSATASLCTCHSTLIHKAYICPQCNSKYCSIPTKCRCCGLFLASPPDISRAFHHLIPPKQFIKEQEAIICSTCNLEVPNGMKCPGCKHLYCEYCDEYIHKELHQCPLCIYSRNFKH